MKKNKYSKQTKLLALGTTIIAGASFMSILRDNKQQVSIRDKVILEQDSYIYSLEQFIMETITGYEIF